MADRGDPMMLGTLGPRLRAKLRRHLLDALDQRGLVRGVGIEISRPHHCRLREFEDRMPGPGELLVETVLSAVSAGTERAIYLGLENVPVDYPCAPGYSQVGRVAVAASRLGPQVGELVFTSGPHASLHLCSSERALLVPPGIPLDAAALTQMGFIALHGIRQARIEPGERIAVLGCGLIGQLAAQLAQVAGGAVVAVGRSLERLEVARRCGVRELLDVRRGRDGLADLRADVVIEATGNAEAVRDAVLAAGHQGRSVLLGSSRGTSPELDLAAWQAKHLTLLGAYGPAGAASGSPNGASSWQRECETFLGLLAQRRLLISPLISRCVPPDEAPRVYADLARPTDQSIAVLFDWSRPGPWTATVQSVSPLRVAVGGLRRVAGRQVASPPVFLPKRSDGRVLRFGLIGCGEIAAESAAALRAANNATITFTADPNAELARGIAAGTDAHYSGSVDELLASPDVDAVLISTPHYLHAPLALQATAAGKHVVVEKPMATTIGDCDRMIEAARRAGVALSVCYCQRYDPRVQRAKRLLDKRLLGDVLGSRIAFGQYRGQAYWSAGLTGRVVSDWRARIETSGGGVLAMNACHLLDSMSWLIGSQVTDVTAMIANLGGLAEVEDTVSMSYRYANGALGTLEATTRQAGPDTFEQSIRGTDGQLVVAPVLRFWSKHTVDGYEGGRWHTVRDLVQPADRRHFFEAFADAVLAGRPVPVDAGEARAVQAIIQGAYFSAKEGRTVDVGRLGDVGESDAAP